MGNALLSMEAKKKDTHCKDCGRIIFDRDKPVRPFENLNGKLYCSVCANNHRNEIKNVEKSFKSFPKRLGFR